MLAALSITLAKAPTSLRTCPSSNASRPDCDAPSGREIEPRAVWTVLDLNNPEVRIERDFPFEPLLRFARIDAVPTMRPSENPLDARGKLGSQSLGRGPVERRTPVQVIDFHENCASFRGAPAAQDRASSFHSAATQIGGDPYVGAQAQRV
jgi:hypothetical protein